MKRYKSPALKHIHEEALDFYKDGIISPAEMREFDQSCLVSGADTSQTRAVHAPAMAAASPGSQGHSVK